jgi:hypothetical protein
MLYQYISGNIQFQSYSSKSTFAISAPDNIFIAHLDTSHNGSPHPFRDIGAVADTLRSIRSGTVKCPFAVNRSCIHTGV